MRVLPTRSDLAAALDSAARPVGVVMTMGALHGGHAELLRVAREQVTTLVVTIFVNPLQFGAGEDLDRYPRTLDADLAICDEAGTDLVFTPDVEQMYPAGDPLVRVDAGPLGRLWEGSVRPGHFDGVLTVVAKLLGLTQADVALFGQKDAQQLLLIKRMVTDLDLGVDIVAVPTVRDPDGLALSSRNVYLSPDDRAAALALSRALRAGVTAAGEGASAVRAAANAVLADEPRLDLDYLALVDPATLTEVGDDAVGETLLAVAGRVGGTHLIDNAPLRLGPATG